MVLTFNANIKYKLSLRRFKHINNNNNNNKLTKIKAPSHNYPKQYRFMHLMKNDNA